MYRPAPIGLLLILWFIGEYIAFIYIISLIGLSGALLIGIASFLIGINTLRHLGLAAFSRMRQNAHPSEKGLDSTIHAVGALLLIIPGFLSDVIGLTLLAPSLRGLVATAFKKPLSKTRANRNPDIIDLDESDWRHIDEGQD